MGRLAVEKPHAVCVPFPAQGHINPMLRLAKLLHAHGFHITFVLTEFNHSRLVRSHGPDAVKGLPGFRFEAIPDGLPPSDDDATQDIQALCVSTTINCLAPFRRLLAKLNHPELDGDVPPVSCVVSDAAMTFTLDAAQELGIPDVLFWTSSASGYLAFQHYRHLVDRGIVPLKDAAELSNGFLDMEVDWIPGLMKGMRLRDFPSFVQTLDAGDVMLHYLMGETGRASKGTAIVFNTFEALEKPAVDALQKFLPPIYTIGPFSLLSRLTIPSGSPIDGISTSLWKEESSCTAWLEGKKPGSVVYVSFGSITVMSPEQLVEFAWGLANSGYDFLWMIRPDLVKGDSAVLPPEFVEETKERGMMACWCAQEEILMHPAVGVFLTHSGWNSTLESFCGAVPMICWPFFSEQLTNCRYTCAEWKVGLEIGNVKREVVEGLIREVLAGEKGKQMKKKSAEWKESAVNACRLTGTSAVNFTKLVNDVLRPNPGSKT
ncbi:UDP-glycosyltransferase 85A2 [Apostasia shenzhenica]|uniref:Glycosyltransferase n=1 Tax=Apostasia shenzhenica TaxID=1088818 RepID=A0A2I0AVA2_9ASPA|nr:UDP-glycosyltransferase 85A2 [Apostasia shenzhenica]